MTNLHSFRAFYKIYMGLTVAGAVIFCCVQPVAQANTGEPTEMAWSHPSVMALKRISGTYNSQDSPNFLSNVDCMATSYRTVSSKEMNTDCFTPTAFGMMDSDDGTVIFNGTDEAVPLKPYSAHEVLVPWPRALNLVTLDAANTGGSYINMYSNPLALMKEQRNLLGRIISKQLGAPPDIHFRLASGLPLVVNPQTLTFSDGGSWLVAENMYGSFMRINLASLEQVDFAPAYGSQGSPALLKSQVAINRTGRYVAVENNVALAFKVYDLAACPQLNLCQSYDYWGFLAHRINGLKSIRHVRFINDRLISFEAITSDSISSGEYLMSPSEGISSLLDYLGMGDSYSSGEGAFDYMSGTDTDANHCHLSINSYPVLLSRDLFSSGGGKSVACSGAVIRDIGDVSGNYRGQIQNGFSLNELQTEQSQLLASVKSNFIPGYIAQHWFLADNQPNVATVSIGGNDIGFGEIVSSCVMPHLSLKPSSNNCYSTYEDRQELIDLVDRTVPHWKALYHQLKTASPESKLYVIGYPEIALAGGSCGVNVHLSGPELVFASQLIMYLNNSIQQAAVESGAEYIDISNALVGHRLCEASGSAVAVNGLTAGKDAGILGVKMIGMESYHPNALGHELIEQTVLKQIRKLDSQEQKENRDANEAAILNSVQKANRAINSLSFVNMTNRLLTRTQQTKVGLEGPSNGLAPNTEYVFHLDGPDGQAIGKSSSDNYGSVTSDINVPGDTTAGIHSIDLTGQNMLDQGMDARQLVYIGQSPNDFDGDGQPNAQDSCEFAINSGVDQDNDGIDDICDPVITDIPADNNEPTHSDGAPVVLANINNDSSPKPPGANLTTPASTSELQPAGQNHSTLKIAIASPGKAQTPDPFEPIKPINKTTAPHSGVLGTSQTNRHSNTLLGPASGLSAIALVWIMSIKLRLGRVGTARIFYKIVDRLGRVVYL